MTTTALRDLPPHLRLLAWPELNGRDPLPGVRLHVPAELTYGPPSLVCHSSTARVEFTPEAGPVDGPGAYEGPESLLTAAGSAGSLTEPLRLVSTLALWDETVREAGVYPGNIYMASEGSVALLLRTAHEGPAGAGASGTSGTSGTSDSPGAASPGPVELGELLEQLYALELLYRFPVAYKFRGAHGLERQCRINGWGRLLFRMLSEAEGDPYGLAAARQRLTRHLGEHRDAYLRGVRAALEAEDGSDGRVWEHIHAEQPIPVLI